MSTLTDTERAILLDPCECGHDLNDHGDTGCWECLREPWNPDCPVRCEELWAERTERIVDRRVAAALREAADALPSLTEGETRDGTARWPDHDRNTYSLAIEEAQATLRARADHEGDA